MRFSIRLYFCLKISTDGAKADQKENAMDDDP